MLKVVNFVLFVSFCKKNGGGVVSCRSRVSWSPSVREEVADQIVEFGGFEQEGVMAEIGGEFGVAGSFAGAEERRGDGSVLIHGEEPVTGEADHESGGRDGREGGFERAGPGGEIELIEGSGDVEV